MSARHIQLSYDDTVKLFGKGYKFSKLRSLSEEKRYACNETVSITTPKRSLEDVRIIGPTVDQTRVELSRSDAVQLGINPPIRMSKSIDLQGTPGLRVVGPQGSILLKQGVIIPKRHIHVDPSDALKFHLRDGNNVRVKIEGIRALVFDQVLILVEENMPFVLHLDVDEANAAAVYGSPSYGTVLAEK